MDRAMSTFTRAFVSSGLFVIGKANRLGLSRFKSAAGTKPERTGTPKIARPRIITQHKNLRALWAKPQIAFGEVSGDSTNRCSLFELQQWHCRWPISEPGAEDFGFCGNKMVDGLPYCEAHARMAYRPGRRVHSHIMGDAATVHRISRPV